MAAFSHRHHRECHLVKWLNEEHARGNVGLRLFGKEFDLARSSTPWWRRSCAIRNGAGCAWTDKEHDPERLRPFGIMRCGKIKD
jgi:hypothetical protein